MSSLDNTSGDVDPLAEATKALEAGDPDTASELINAVLEEEPSNDAALWLAIGAALNRDDSDEMIARSDQLLNLDSTAIPPRIMKAYGLSMSGDHEGAIAISKEAVELADDPEGLSKAWSTQSDVYSNAGIVDEAVAAGRKAVELDANSEGAWISLGRALSKAKEPREALDAIGRALTLDSTNIELLLFKAVLLSELDQRQDALAVVEEAYLQAPSYPDVLKARAILLVLVQRLEDAVPAFDEWIAAEPDNSAAHSAFGLLMLLLSEYDRALSKLKQASLLNPTEPRIDYWLAMTYFVLDQNTDAMEIVTRIIADNPNDADAWTLKASIERDLGFPLQAIESARQGLELSAFSDVDAWRELARAYADSGHHDSAANAFIEAANMDPDDIDTQVAIAVELIQGGRESEAFSHLQETEDRAGPHPLIEFNRGVIHHRLGKELLARDAWRRAYDLDPSFTAAEVLVDSFRESTGPGGWVEYWFGATKKRSLGALILIGLLVLALGLPTVEAGIIPGVRTGRSSFESYVPAIVLLVLLILPAIRALSVGGVSVSVAPRSSEDEPQRLDPAQILPAFAIDDLDPRRLTQR